MKRTQYIIGLVAVVVFLILYNAMTVVPDDSNQPLNQSEEDKHNSAMIAVRKNLGDHPEKIEFLIEAASNGDVEIQRYLGTVYAAGHEGVKPDINVAVEWYKMAALRGDSDSQIKLADMYTKGDGVEKDIDQAIVYLEKAANGLGRAVDAQMILGSLYYKGEQISKNDKEALRWFKKAAENDKIQAQAILGLIYSTSKDLIDYEEAAKWYEMAAEQGDVNAEFNYALMLFEGKGGIEQDYEQALTWFKKAMAQNHKGAQTYVGAMYADGLGTPVNYSTALRWLVPVAEEGYVFAQRTIADVYTKKGNVNDVRAFMWYEIAYRNGLKSAKILRNDIATYMSNEKIDAAMKKADEWIEESKKKQAEKKAKAVEQRKHESLYD